MKNIYENWRSGGIVYRETDEGRVYLMITSVSHPDTWIIPAGHVEPGEQPSETAVRETLEESGILAEVITQLPTMEHEWNRGGKLVKVRTDLFLMKYVETVNEGLEGRKIAFVTLEEMSELKMWDETKAVFAKLKAQI